MYKNVTLIGGGSMGSAIAAGIVRSGVREANCVTVCDSDASKLEALGGALGINTCSSAQECLAAKPDVVILAVKPQVLPELVSQNAEALGSCGLVVSIAAGVKVAQIEELLSSGWGAKPHVVRVMPNLAMAVGSGASAICAGEHATSEDTDAVVELFGTMGPAYVLREDQVDAEGAVVGCEPAFVALMIDALTRRGVEAGLPAEAARQMITSTMRGVCQQLLDSGEHPRAYMERVSSPGGTTIVGLRALEPYLTAGIDEAIDAALARTEELSRA